MGDTTQRLDDLEMHVAHQDSTIDALNDVVLKQWDEIRALTDKIARLEAKLSAIEAASEGEQTPEPPPPHY